VRIVGRAVEAGPLVTGRAPTGHAVEVIPSSDDAVGPTRRSFLALGGLAVAGAAGAAGAGRVGGAGGAALEQPTVLRSARGRLDVRLVADSGTWLGGQYTQAFGYNRSSPGPTLVVSPGDVLAIRLVNRLNQPTNLHTHGRTIRSARTGTTRIGTGTSPTRLRAGCWERCWWCRTRGPGPRARSTESSC
jgi:hypothetical protein